MEDGVDFVTELGRAMTAHRLRRLGEQLLEDYSSWLPKAGVTAPPRSLSTIRLLEEHGPLGVTEIAFRLRLSHPLLVKLIDTLEQQGFVALGTDPTDARRRPVWLTAPGRREATQVRRALAAMEAAFSGISDEVGVDLFDLVSRVENACERDPLPNRLDRLWTQIASEEMTCD